MSIIAKHNGHPCKRSNNSLKGKGKDAATLTTLMQKISFEIKRHLDALASFAKW
jgi:hypothetical protein